MEIGLDQVADWCDAERTPSEAAPVVRHIVTDSRESLPPGSLFVALDGEHFDAHRFLDEAAAKGAVAALVSRLPDEPTPDDLPYLVVDDTLEALQQIAGRWRRQFDIPIVGVTGSNGKTIVKEMLGGICSRDRTTYRSPASYNSQVGVPLSLLGLEEEHRLAIIEAGISRPGEMERLEPMIAPTAGLLTNIGLAHAAGLKTLETTAREKLELFTHLGDGPLVYPAGCEPLKDFDLPGRPVSFGCRFATDTAPAVEEADYLALNAQRTNAGYDFGVAFPDGRRHHFALHVPGEHNLRNAVAAIALADQLDIPVEAMREGLVAYESSPLRLEMHTTPRGVTLINDAYSSDPVSARAALQTLQQYGRGGRTIAILGDMLDLGARSEAAHRELGRAVARADIDRLICYGERARHIGQSAVDSGFSAESVRYIEEIDTLHDLLESLLQPDDLVLFKASRRLELDRAAERLLESVAPTRLQIDLEAIRSNYHALRRQIGADARFMAVVKSFAYGNDATRVAQTLSQEGVDALGVAYPDEGIPLRRRGMRLPILVMNVLADEADKIVKYDLAALVYNRDVVRALEAQARRRGSRVDVHIKVDTGMNRVGLAPQEILEFAEFIADRSHVELTGIMTHFAVADVPSEDDFTRGQIDAFRRVLDRLDDRGIDPGTIHAANTAAAWRFPEAHFDMVRVGLGLYGLAPSDAVDETADETEPALRFTTQIVHLKEVDPGDTVGYGRTWRADQPRRIATIAAGYNDGLPRFMSNGGEVLVAGHRCPIVGSVCMDVAMVDVTDAPDSVAIGDEVVLFGRQQDARITVDEIAKRGETINYEILCNISPRVRRIFVRR